MVCRRALLGLWSAICALYLIVGSNPASVICLSIGVLGSMMAARRNNLSPRLVGVSSLVMQVAARLAVERAHEHISRVWSALTATATSTSSRFRVGGMEECRSTCPPHPRPTLPNRSVEGVCAALEQLTLLVGKGKVPVRVHAYKRILRESASIFLSANPPLTPIQHRTRLQRSFKSSQGC